MQIEAIIIKVICLWSKTSCDKISRAPQPVIYLHDIMTRHAARVCILTAFKAEIWRQLKGEISWFRYFWSWTRRRLTVASSSRLYEVSNLLLKKEVLIGLRWRSKLYESEKFSLRHLLVAEVEIEFHNSFARCQRKCLPAKMLKLRLVSVSSHTRRHIFILLLILHFQRWTELYKPHQFKIVITNIHFWPFGSFNPIYWLFDHSTTFPSLILLSWNNNKTIHAQCIWMMEQLTRNRFPLSEI